MAAASFAAGMAGNIGGYENRPVANGLLVLAAVCLLGAWGPAAYQYVHPGPDLRVGVIEDAADNLGYEARFIELKLRIENRTSRQKKLDGWELQVQPRETLDGISPMSPDAPRVADQRQRGHQQLPEVIDPRATVEGWMVFPLPWSPVAPDYALTVTDEMGVRYEARKLRDRGRQR